MGNQNDKNAKNKELNNIAKTFKPIMPNKEGRACTIEDGKIVLNFHYFKEEYDSLNLNLDKIKNKMNIIISDEMIEMIQIRLENFKKLSKNDEISTSIDSFTSTYKTSLSNYYNLLSEIKKIYKEIYLSIASFLTNWIKVQQETDTKGELAKMEECEKKFDDIQNNFNSFNDIEQIINKICYFNINYNSNDKLNEIKNYFEENKDDITGNYNFENSSQLRSLINFKDQIIDSINQKNNFVEVLKNYFKEYNSLYKKVLTEINSTNLEKVEMANELNEFNAVIIYHRLIRSIEERIKKIKI